MTVQELINKLRSYNPSLLVVISRDSEGNGYSVLYNMNDNATFNGKDGSVGIQRLTPDLEELGYTNEDVKEGVPCLVLYP